MTKTYFTFGTASHFPYGRDEYVVIEALDQQKAIKEFMTRFPDEDPNIINCAFYYTEKEWIDGEIGEKYYKDVSPVKYIVVNPTKEDIRDLVTNFVYTSINSFVLGTSLRNAFPEQSEELYNLINSIPINMITNVDYIMEELETNGYFDQITNDCLDNIVDTNSKKKNDDLSLEEDEPEI